MSSKSASNVIPRLIRVPRFTSTTKPAGKRASPLLPTLVAPSAFQIKDQECLVTKFGYQEYKVFQWTVHVNRDLL